MDTCHKDRQIGEGKEQKDRHIEKEQKDRQIDCRRGTAWHTGRKMDRLEGGRNLLGRLLEVFANISSSKKIKPIV